MVSCEIRTRCAYLRLGLFRLDGMSHRFFVLRLLPCQRLLELNAQAVDSALGFGTLAPGARLQHELTAEIERAKHRALWVRARAVRPPGNDATTWHAAENAEHLKAYAAKAAFEQGKEKHTGSQVLCFFP